MLEIPSDVPDMAFPIPRNPNKPKWAEFEFNKRPLGAPAEMKPGMQFEGWDSETIQAPQYGPLRGNAFMLANSQEFRIIESPEQFRAALRFMWYNGIGKLNALWNIDYDVRTFFKWDLDALAALYPEGNDIGWARIGQIEIKYLKKKELAIRSQERTAKFYDAFSFYQQSLAKAAQKYLKRDPPDVKAQRSEDLYAYWKNEPDLISDYCIWDAKATRDLMLLVYQKLEKMDFRPKRPISAGKLAEDFLLKHTNYPHLFNVDSSINGAAWEAFKGGWVDLWKRGTFEIYKYDLNSAYPFVMRNFPDLRDGYWIEEAIPESALGIVRVRITQSTKSVPALAAWMRATLGYPTFDVPIVAWITLEEYLTLKQCEGINVELLKAFSFIPKANARYPFQKPVDLLCNFKNRFHNKRGIEPDDGAYLAAKQIVNSLYGKTCQKISVGLGDDRIFKAGKLFNPVYAANITGKTRCLITNAIKKDLQSVIAIATDCIATTKRLQLRENDSEMGAWKVEAENETGTFVFPGIYEIYGEGSNYTSHSRGFRISSCLCFHDSKQHFGSNKCQYCACDKFVPSLKALLKQCEGKSLPIRFEKPWGVRESIRQKDMDKVGVFESRLYEKTIDSIRRIWLQNPASFRDLLDHQYNSVPVPVSVILDLGA